MSKLKSRKLWAFIVWSVFMILTAILKPDLPEVQIKFYGYVTLLYVVTQGTIDAIVKWKIGKKDD